MRMIGRLVDSGGLGWRQGCLLYGDGVTVSWTLGGRGVRLWRAGYGGGDVGMVIKYESKGGDAFIKESENV